MDYTVIISICYLFWLQFVMRSSFSKSSWFIVPWLFLLHGWNYAIRPIVLSVNDYWLDNRFAFASANEYNQIYLIALAGYCSIQLGYITYIKVISDESREQFKGKSYHRHFAIGALAIISYLFIRVGPAWLGANRSVAASVIIPEFRFLFPLFVLLLLAYFFRSHMLFSGLNKRRHAVFLFFLATLFVTLFHVRGYLVYLILWSIPYFKKDRLVSLTGIGLLVYVVFFSRRIGSDTETTLDLLELVSSNGDTIDTWFIVKDFVQVNGLLNGEGILKNVFNILPLDLRYRLGLSCSWDLMNIHYAGDDYLSSRYGYNLDTPQELFMNFGALYIPLGFFLGRLLGLLDMKVVTNRIACMNPFQTALLFILIQNVFSLASFHWTLLYGFIVLFRMIWKRR